MNAQGKISAVGRVTTMTSREFNQHTGSAKTAAAKRQSASSPTVANRPRVAQQRGIRTIEFNPSSAYRTRNFWRTPGLKQIFEFEFERAKGGSRGDADFW